MESLQFEVVAAASANAALMWASDCKDVQTELTDVLDLARQLGLNG